MKGIQDPWLSTERAYNTFKADSEVPLGSLLGGNDINYVAHKGCVHRARDDGQNQRELSDTNSMTRRKDMADGSVLNCYWRATDNGEWITSIRHCLNGKELSRE